MIQRKVIRKALRNGTVPTIKAMRRRAPRATGLFSRSLNAVFRSYKGGAVQVEVMGQKSEVKNRKKLKAGRGGISGRGDIVPIHLVDQPTKPHGIPKTVRLKQVKTTKAWRDEQRSKGLSPRKYREIRRLYKPLAIQVGGQLVIRASAKHPGTKGARFMMQAAMETASQTVQRFSQRLAEEVERETNAIT